MASNEAKGAALTAGAASASLGPGLIGGGAYYGKKTQGDLKGDYAKKYRTGTLATTMLLGPAGLLAAPLMKSSLMKRQKAQQERDRLKQEYESAIGRYGSMADQGAGFQDIDDPRIAEELTDQERAQLEAVNRGTDERLRGQREATMQNLAQRGMGGSGQELAAQLAQQQGAAQRQSLQQQQVLSDAAGRRQRALGQLGSMSTTMGEGDRQAKMNLAQFNSQQRLRQQQMNNTMRQQGFMNKATIYGNMAGMRQQGSEAQSNRLLQMSQRAKDRGMAMTGKGLEVAGQMAGSFSKMSDINSKENITHAGKQLDTFMENITPYEYNYIGDDTSDRRISPMAQDLLKSGLGSEFVFENKDGVLMVDYGKALGTMMATIGHLNNKISRLEKKNG
jgi:hypothetical protein